MFYKFLLTFVLGIGRSHDLLIRAFTKFSPFPFFIKLSLLFTHKLSKMTNEEFIKSVSLEGEIWKDVVGFEEKYFISNFGLMYPTYNPYQ